MTLKRALTCGVLAVLALAPAAHAAGPAAGGVRDHRYVADSIAIGSTAAEADGHGMQLDNRYGRDNVLGSVLAGLSSIIDVDAAIAESLEAGQVLMLHALRTRSLSDDRSAWLRTYFAQPTPDPVLSGGGSFAIDPAAGASTTLAGTISDGDFSGGPGAAAMRLALVPGRPPIELHLAGARIQSRCTADGCSGKLGGGVPVAEVDTLVIPELAAAMQRVVDAGCTTPSIDSCSVTARQILYLLDANGDREITAGELRSSILIQSVLAPDLDLFAAGGRPGRDGVRDAVSLGLGFTTRSATFDAPRGAGANHPVTGSRPALGPQRAFVAHLQEVFDQFCGCIHGGTTPEGLRAGRATAMGAVDEIAYDVSAGFDDWPAAFDVGMHAGSLISESSGDELIVSYHVTATDIADPPAGENYTLQGTFVIEGGSGALLNAAGSGTIAGTCTSSFTSPFTYCATDWKGTVGTKP